MRVSLSILSLSLLLLAPGIVLANSPPPWHGCESGIEGDTCDPYSGDDGVCTVQQACSDDPGTERNECLWCEATDSGGCTISGAGGPALPSMLLLAGLVAALVVRRRR